MKIILLIVFLGFEFQVGLIFIKRFEDNVLIVINIPQKIYIATTILLLWGSVDKIFKPKIK